MSTDGGAPAFDLDLAWQLHPQVAVREERFGALLYHFGTRRLSFLKTPTLAVVLNELARATSARAAIETAGVRKAETASYARALAQLAKSDMIRERSVP